LKGTRFKPKRPKRLFKEPKIEKARRLAKILFREPTIEELKLEHKLYLENIMKANKKRCDHTTQIGYRKIQLRNIYTEKIGNSEYLFITCAKCGALLEIRKR